MDLDLTGTQGVVQLSSAGSELSCAESSATCPRADTAAKRKWRHLDMMQFISEIRAPVPRCRYETSGVRTIQVPWAGEHSRLTLMFRLSAIWVLQASANVKNTAQLLGLSRDAARRIVASAFETGLQRRDAEPEPNVGTDQNSFGRGQNYVSVITDIDRLRVLSVLPARLTAACDALRKSLAPVQFDAFDPKRWTCDRGGRSQAVGFTMP